MRNYAGVLALAGAVSGYTNFEHQQIMVKNIDPIVYPGQYKSHMHSFYGSDAVTKNLPTTAELQKGCVSGANPNDASVYWIPTLYYARGAKDFVEIRPSSFQTYYNKMDKAEIGYPKDWFVISGNSTAKSQRDVDETATGVSWWCEYGPAEAPRDGGLFPLTGCSKGRLQVILRFPDCVNPTNPKLYAFSVNNGKKCPSGMKRVPELRFSVRYDYSNVIKTSWTGKAPLKLACGNVGEGYCFHGDFINGWYESGMKNLLKSTDTKQWQRIDGEKGAGDAGGKCTTKDKDPSGGTSDYNKSVEMMGM